MLAAAGLVFGLTPGLLERMLEPYADSVPGGSDYHLALWHGWNLPLLLSVGVLAVGTASFIVRAQLPRSRTGWLPLGNADRIYDATLRGLEFVAFKVTGATQRGSIPATQSVILLTLVGLPVAVLALGARDRPDLRLWEGPLQPVVGVLMVAGALGATMMRNRLAAVLLVGVTGYGCGAIFAFHGAPDLALTQFLVETLTLVIFVLVLRTLPAEADAENMRRLRVPRALLAIAVGATVTGLAAFAMAARTTTPVSALLPDAAYDRGHGANTVNVILVDIRAWDTLGEISVLLVAATGCRVTGVPAPAFRRRPTRPAGRRPARHRSDRGPHLLDGALQPGCR